MMTGINLFKIIKERRSIRRYKEKEIPMEEINKILEAGIYAPSAGNRQPWEFIIVRRNDNKKKLAEAAYNQNWIMEAPVIMVVCTNINRTAIRYGERGRTLYCIQDTAAAIQNILLAAYTMGYGTCWVGAFNEQKVKEILNIPRDIRPVALITIGIPAERPTPPPRIPLERLTHMERY